MKPQVTFNDIDTDSIENNLQLSESEKLKLFFRASLINSLGKERCDYHKGLDIIETTDGKKPYVIVICYLDKGVVDSDRNY
ncbi:hypothetical protein [Gelidibacter japonicus]|uniref:hypothetical protein n=1 Tax=Gelidibacter japonicus TaxID=1962232 RepID=UPI0013D3E9FF|nr:hypothetical protein [Gelidibacter japonicus]